VESKLSPLGTSATYWPIVPALGTCEDGEFGGMKIGRGNRSTRRKPAPTPLCPPQIPLARPGSKHGRRGGKPATNRLSYSAASITRKCISCVSKIFDSSEFNVLIIMKRTKLTVLHSNTVKRHPFCSPKDYRFQQGNILVYIIYKEQ
jgi:hypothetical protein